MGMPADMLALVLAVCSVAELPHLAATNKLMNEMGAERRRKLAVLVTSPLRSHVILSDVSFGQRLHATMVQFSCLTDSDMIQLSEALACGAMAQLQVSWLPTAMLPCLETWHTRSPGLTVSFGVLYVPYAEALPPIKLYRRCGCNGSGPGVRRWRNGPVAGELAPHCHDPMP